MPAAAVTAAALQLTAAPPAPYAGPGGRVAEGAGAVAAPRQSGTLAGVQTTSAGAVGAAPGGQQASCYYRGQENLLAPFSYAAAVRPPQRECGHAAGRLGLGARAPAAAGAATGEQRKDCCCGSQGGPLTPFGCAGAMRPLQNNHAATWTQQAYSGREAEVKVPFPSPPVQTTHNKCTTVKVSPWLSYQETNPQPLPASEQLLHQRRPDGGGRREIDALESLSELWQTELSETTEPEKRQAVLDPAKEEEQQMWLQLLLQLEEKDADWESTQNICRPKHRPSAKSKLPTLKWTVCVLTALLAMTAVGFVLREFQLG